MQVKLTGKVSVNGVEYGIDKVIESDDEREISRAIWHTCMGLNATISTELNLGDYKKEDSHADHRH